MTIKESVYNSIYEDVCNGKYEPNQIITEGSLCEKYQVSKTPIREALIELCKDKVLQNLPRLGYQVVPVSLKEVLDVIDFRIDIEVSGLRKGFEKMTDQELEALLHLAHKKPEEIGNLNWDRNMQFHLGLYQLSRNDIGYDVLTKILRQNTRYISQYFQSEWRQANANKSNCHEEILKALSERELERAVEMLTRDIRSVRDEIIKYHQ